MSSSPKTDYIAMWFQARKEFGIGDRMNVGLLNKSAQQINWFEFAHSQMDGLGGLTTILREHDYPCTNLPKSADKVAPSNWQQIKMLLAGSKLTHLKTIRWKTTYPDYAAITSAANAALEVADKSLGEYADDRPHGRSNKLQYNNDAPIVNAYFSKETTIEIKKLARKHKVALNIYLFWALNRAIAEQLLASQQDYYWLYPVNLRGALPNTPETGNCSSGINVLLNNTISAREIQLQVKQQIKAKSHWQLWWQAHLGKIVGQNGVRRIYQYVSERQFYAGSFSFLGSWPLKDANNPPVNEDDVWVCCGIGTKNYPVSTGILLWHDQLSLGLKLHPYIAENISVTEATMRAWKQHLLQGDLLMPDKAVESVVTDSASVLKKPIKNSKFKHLVLVKVKAKAAQVKSKLMPSWLQARALFIRHKKISIPLSIVAFTFVCMTLLSVVRPQSQIKPEINRFPSVRYMNVAFDDAVIPIFSRGLVTAKTIINLSSEVTARVNSVAANFTAGGYFKAGDVLLSMDDEAYQLEVIKKQQAVDSALLHLAETKAKAHVARRGVSRKATNFARHIPQLNDAKSRVKSARADLRLANLKLERTVIKAPFSGRVKAATVGLGQLVNAGEVIGEIFSLDTMHVRLPVADKYLTLMVLPQQISSFVNSSSVNTLSVSSSSVSTSSVTNISSKPSNSSSEARYPSIQPIAANPKVTLSVSVNNKRFQWQGSITGTEGGLAENRLQYLVAEVQNDPDQPLYLQPGRFVKAEISGREFKQLVIIPRLALRNDNKVWLLDAQQRLQIVTVDVLHQGKERVYIKAGLTEGQKLILTPLDVAVSGMKLNVISLDTVKHSVAKQSITQQNELKLGVAKQSEALL